MNVTKKALVSFLVAATSRSTNFVIAFAPPSSSKRLSSARLSPGDVLSTNGGAVSTSFLLSPQKRRLTATRSRAGNDNDDEDEDDGDDDEDAFEPMSDGIDSVQWLPTVIGATADTTGPALSRKGSEILPLFPLGGIVYTPNSEHVLNIFEPRYRLMYTDILMNGTKRFVVVMSHPQESGRFAKTGVLFELQDLKEVSEKTKDKIKYICSHKVTGRVTIHRILNPEAWESRDTYLRVEGTITDDSGKTKDDDNDDSNKSSSSSAEEEESSNPVLEQAVRDSFRDLVSIQHDLQETVRFTRASVSSLAVSPTAGETSLWQTIRLWQNFADQRLMARQTELSADFQQKLQEYLKKEKGLKQEELPSAIGFEALTPGLQKEVRELQNRIGVELRPLVLESMLSMQKILEAENHTARLKLVKYFIDAETKRLSTKKTLKGMFSTDNKTSGSGSGKDDDDDDDAAAAAAGIPPEERLSEKDEKPTTPEEPSSPPESSSSSLFVDEEDAFQ